MKKILLIVLVTLVVNIGYGQNIVKIGDNNYQVRILMGNFHLQKISNYAQDDNDEIRSWAACVEMALDYQGVLGITQEQILTSAFNSSKDFVGGPPELMSAVNTFKPTVFGQQAHVYCENATINEDAIFDELSINRPLIAGLHNISNIGTANVILAMNYSINRNASGEQTGITPTTVTVASPWPTISGLKTISWGDFIKSINALYSLRVSIGK